MNKYINIYIERDGLGKQDDLCLSVGYNDGSTLISGPAYGVYENDCSFNRVNAEKLIQAIKDNSYE